MSIREQQKRTKQLHFSLDSPYAAVKWPEISSEDQDNFLQLLLSLLAPVGAYRQNDVVSSKGKRSKVDTNSQAALNVQSAPAVASYLLVGINAITAHLTALAQLTRPSAIPVYEPMRPNPHAKETLAPLIAIFIAPGPTNLTAHIPLQVAISTTTPSMQPRLVRLPQSTSTRLASALNISHVSAVGVCQCPEAATLLKMVIDKVNPVIVPWLGNLAAPEKERHYNPTAIHADQISEERTRRRQLKKTQRRERRSSARDKARATNLTHVSE